MHFNSARTFFSFLCFHFFSMFLTPRGVEPRAPSLCCWHPAKFLCNHVLFYYSHTSLPFVACSLPSSQRRQPESSIVNASWRHDSTPEFSSATTAVPSSFRSIIQTFTVQWQSTVWDPSFFQPYKTQVPPPPTCPPQPPSFPAAGSRHNRPLFSAVGSNPSHPLPSSSTRYLQ